MKQKNYTSFDSFFQDLGVEITNISHERINNIKTIIFNVKSLSSNITHCPFCGSVSYIRHGYTERKLKHVKVFGYNSIILYKQCRFLCKDCMKSFNEECKIARKSSRLTTQLRSDILFECKEKQSFLSASKRLNISITSVLNEFKNNIAIPRKKLSRIICIDEFKANTEYGKFAFIIGDPVSGEILDILAYRTQEQIYYYFQELSIAERKIAEIIVSDLSNTYRHVIRNLFPNAIHIVDRFHWIKLSTSAFNNLRIKTMNNYLFEAEHTLDQEKKIELRRYATLMKNYYKLFLINKHKKGDAYFEEVTKAKVNGSLLTRQELIEYIINSNKDLENGYHLLQDLYKISMFSSLDTFEKDLDEWFKDVEKAEIKLFEKVKNTYKSWKKEIKNSFIIDKKTNIRFTNGFIEGKNNLCKVIKRISFGYKKFRNLRSKILYIDNELLKIKN